MIDDWCNIFYLNSLHTISLIGPLLYYKLLNLNCIQSNLFFSVDNHLWWARPTENMISVQLEQ